MHAEKYSNNKNDEFVRSTFYHLFVIPAKAGIQLNQAVLGSRLRGSDGFSDFLRDHQYLFFVSVLVFLLSILKICVYLRPNIAIYGGESGIRTHGPAFDGTHDFQSCTFGQLGHLSVYIIQDADFRRYPQIEIQIYKNLLSLFCF